MSTDTHTVAVTSSDLDDRPWHRRSRLWASEDEIRRLQAEGYSLTQIIRRLSLGVSRPYLWRWLRRADAAAARAAGEPAPAALPAVPGTDEADDAAAEALLATADFSPPIRRTP
jgi:hypothetical protein